MDAKQAEQQSDNAIQRHKEVQALKIVEMQKTPAYQEQMEQVFRAIDYASIVDGLKRATVRVPYKLGPSIVDGLTKMGFETSYSTLLVGFFVNKVEVYISWRSWPRQHSDV